MMGIQHNRKNIGRLMVSRRSRFQTAHVRSVRMTRGGMGDKEPKILLETGSGLTFSQHPANVEQPRNGLVANVTGCWRRVMIEMNCNRAESENVVEFAAKNEILTKECNPTVNEGHVSCEEKQDFHNRPLSSPNERQFTRERQKVIVDLQASKPYAITSAKKEVTTHI